MVRLLRCLVLAQSTPKLHHKEAKRRFIVSITLTSVLKFVYEVLILELYMYLRCIVIIRFR